MGKFVTLGFVFIIGLILLNSVIAQTHSSDQAKVELNLQNVVFSEDLIYNYKILDKNEIVSEGITSVNGGFLYLEVPKGYYHIKILVDDPKTEGNDYYGIKSDFFPLRNDEVLSFSLFEVGSLNILIEDLKGTPIENALIRIDCEKKYGQQGYYDSDNFGIVSLDYLPVGQCIIRAVYEDFLGKQIVAIHRGATTDATIVFDGSIKNDFNWLLFVVIVIIIFGLALLFMFEKNKKSKFNENQNEPNHEQAYETSSSNKEDIIKVLNKKEKLVVNFMLEKKSEHSGKNEFYVSQADIVYGAGIPKTSLMRVLSSLEEKKIVLVERMGKLKKVSFSPWFESK